jgi:cytoskeletal protein CcmA (bactofilin family)
MFVKKKEAPAPLALAPLEQPRSVAPPAQAAAPSPAPARTKPASLFAQGLTIRGNILGDVEAHIDCVVMGDVKVGKLILGPNARIEGSIVAQAIEIHGLVIGPITAQAVRLYGTARVDGDITHEQLAMEPGAAFQGRSLKFRRSPQPAQASTVAPQPQAAQPAPTPPSASQTPYNHMPH